MCVAVVVVVMVGGAFVWGNPFAAGSGGGGVKEGISCWQSAVLQKKNCRIRTKKKKDKTETERQKRLREV